MSSPSARIRYCSPEWRPPPDFVRVSSTPSFSIRRSASRMALPCSRLEQALLDQHDGLRLVEGVERVEHEARAAGGQLAQLREHFFAEPDAAGAEPAVLG